MRAVLYTRESKGSAEAVARQREDGLELAQRRGYDVVATLGDADTSAAGKRARPDFEKLLMMARSGHVGAIVAWSWDRLERNRRDTVRLIEACQDHGIIIALVRGSDVDLSTPAGRLSADVLASVARHEIEAKSDRMARAQLQAAEAGKPPRRRAFGYLDGGAIDPVEGPAVVEAFNRLLAGGSISGITRWLNDHNFPTTGNLLWTNPGVRKLLRNPRYAAIRAYRGVEVGPGTWEPIVTEDVYRAVVALLDDPARRVDTGGRARKWMGARLYLCGRCGASMKTAYRTYESPSYGKKKVRIYQCRNSKHLTRVAEPIDRHVTEVIAARLRRADVADLLAEAAPDLQPLRTEASALRQRIRQLAKDLSVDERTLAIRDRALRDRLAEVEAELSEAGGKSSALARLAAAPSPEQAWRDLDDVLARQAVIRDLAIVTLLPGKSGNRAFDPATVRITPL